jgi:hypothetical protein
VRERAVLQRTGIITQIRAILATRTDALWPELAGDWRRLDQRIDPD